MKDFTNNGNVRDFYRDLGIDLPNRNQKNLKVKCFVNPNHDTEPSCSIKVITGQFNCFGCQAKGGPYDAAIAVGRKPAQAMELLERHGLIESESDPSQPPTRSSTPLVDVDEPEPLPPPEDVENWHLDLIENEKLMRRLMDLRGWRYRAIVDLAIGFDGERITLPTPNASGELQNVLRYSPNPERRNGEPKMLALRGRPRELHPPPEIIPREETLYLTDGEADDVAGRSVGLETVGVPGMGNFRQEDVDRFAGRRRVVVITDSHEMERSAARAVAESIAGVVPDVRVLDLAPDRDDRFDLTDFVRQKMAEGCNDDAIRLDLELRTSEAQRVGSTEISTSQVDPESLGDVLEDLTGFLRRYVVMTEAQLVACSLWIFHTHVFDALDISPYVAISSAEMRSGKTTLMKLLALLCARPWSVITPSPAVVFRKIEQDRPTVLLDEYDTIWKDRDQEPLRALLNAGNEPGAKVPRCEGTNRDELKEFSVFSPKALAGIGKLPATIADRAIEIRLKRKAPHEEVDRFRRREVRAEAEQLREQLAELGVNLVDELANARPELPESLNDRAQDSWEPLLAIADAAGDGWPARARQAAAEISAKDVDDESRGVQLLATIKAVFDQQNIDQIKTSELIYALATDEESHWADWWNEKDHTPERGAAQKLSARLKPYEIRPKNLTFEDEKRLKGYERRQFEDIWSRYLTNLESTPEGPT